MSKKWVVGSTMFMGGLFIMAFGIVCMIQADLGVAPWDVLHIGLVKTVGWSVGTWSQVLGIAVIFMTILMTRKVPGIGAFLNMFFVGYFVDLIMDWHWIGEPETLLQKSILFLIGLVLSGAGTGMYIAPAWGAGPRDGFMLAVAMMTKWPFGRVRTLVEVAVLVIGWILGGPVFFGTLVFCLTIGFICQYFIALWKKLLDKAIGREVYDENINKRSIRINHHDGIGPTIR